MLPGPLHAALGVAKGGPPVLEAELPFEDVLRRLAVIKMELNHLYTEVPHDTPSGPDWGWFCREHALNTFLLFRLLGFQAYICMGSIVIEKVGNKRVISCYPNETGHAWCFANDLGPVDLSVELVSILKLQLPCGETVTGKRRSVCCLHLT